MRDSEADKQLISDQDTMEGYLQAPFQMLCGAIAQGPYVPGAGSVAAVGGAAAAALVVAACRVNKKAETGCRLTASEIGEILVQAQEHMTVLQSAVQADADAFGLVGDRRDKRNCLERNTDQWRELDDQCCSLLIETAPILFQIAQYSIGVGELGCRLAERGVWWVAGDCHVATYLSLASAEGALATLRLNTYTVQEYNQAWSIETIQAVNPFEKKIESLRKALAKNPVRSYPMERRPRA